MTDQQEQSDFEFFMGEVVNVGSNQGAVIGQATYAYATDRFLIAFPMNDDGLPFEQWFEGYQIGKTPKH